MTSSTVRTHPLSTLILVLAAATIPLRGTAGTPGDDRRVEKPKSAPKSVVIQAMEQQGTKWNYDSPEQPKYVKMLLCATASETNAARRARSQCAIREPQLDDQINNTFGHLPIPCEFSSCYGDQA